MDEIELGTETDHAGARSSFSSIGFDQQYVLLGIEP
jgi:hypothetical protein